MASAKFGDRVGAHYSSLYDLIYEVCRDKNVRIKISEKCLLDVVTHFFKDMKTIYDRRDKEVTVNQRIAELVLLINRLKPVSFACLEGDRGVEISDINEHVAIWVAHRLLVSYVESNLVMRIVRRIRLPDKKAQFDRYLAAHWKSDNYLNYANLVHLLRYQDCSAHHLALLFDALATGFALKHMLLV